MNGESLRHDVAWATAQQILEVFGGLLREEEQRQAFAEIYVRVKAGLECYETRSERVLARIRPGKN
ncbi:MAG TPA: hypothetical protein VK395_18565 [Gemmataceae bacterium]|nr:hypothetical protein [Gemmataceae bacterium]